MSFRLQRRTLCTIAKRHTASLWCRAGPGLLWALSKMSFVGPLTDQQHQPHTAIGDSKAHNVNVTAAISPFIHFVSLKTAPLQHWILYGQLPQYRSLAAPRKMYIFLPPNAFEFGPVGLSH